MTARYTAYPAGTVTSASYRKLLLVVEERSIIFAITEPEKDANYEFLDAQTTSLLHGGVLRRSRRPQAPNDKCTQAQKLLFRDLAPLKASRRARHCQWRAHSTVSGGP